MKMLVGPVAVIFNTIGTYAFLFYILPDVFAELKRHPIDNGNGKGIPKRHHFCFIH